jgi:hypothetical protein
VVCTPSRIKHTSVIHTLIAKMKDLKIFIHIEKNTCKAEKKHCVFLNRITHRIYRNYTFTCNMKNRFKFQFKINTSTQGSLSSRSIVNRCISRENEALLALIVVL